MLLCQLEYKKVAKIVRKEKGGNTGNMVFGGETFMGHIYVGATPPKKKMGLTSLKTTFYNGR